MKEKEVDPVRP